MEWAEQADLVMSQPINTDQFSAVMRSRGIALEDRTIAVTRLSGSLQEEDLSEPANCQGLGRIRHFRRETAKGWPENPLPIDPAARALGLGHLDELRAQVFQNAVCNWRCWYCYVDFGLLSANPAHTENRTAAELIDLYLADPKRPAVIDLSGGQPDLVPEWVAWMLTELDARGLSEEVYLWSDDNLSNDYYFQLLNRDDRTRIETAGRYGKVCCLKGFDATSFAFNTAAAPELFERQLDLLRRLVTETDLDIYCYATFTTPKAGGLEAAMNAFVDRLQTIHPLLPLRLVPLQVGKFSPVIGRLTDERCLAMHLQDAAVAAWSGELNARFDSDQRKLAISDVPLNAR
jgi:uncharacterized Fe-S cluster-containing radical SAM superfamily protein